MKCLVVAGAMLLLAHAGVASADAMDEVWLGELTDQIGEVHQCDVAFFQRVREYALAGETVQEARVSCLDRRQYDARRTLPDESFAFEDCTPVLC